MYKILIISPLYFPYHLGGAEISTQLLAEGLNQNELFSVDVFTHGTKDADEVINGVRVIRHHGVMASDLLLKKAQGLSISKPAAIISKVNDMLPRSKRKKYYLNLFKQYDMVILSGNGTKMGRYDIWCAAQKAQIPLIQIIRDPMLLYAFHGRASSRPFVDHIYQRIAALGLDRVPYVVGITKWMLDEHEKYDIHFNHTAVIPNMVDDRRCKQDTAYDKKENIILYVGAISKNKGCHTLISAFQQIEHVRPEYRLVMIGRNIDVTIPADDKIILKGHLDLPLVYENMQRAKLVVLPSEWAEAFGRVVVEAVFNGTIAVGSNSGGIPEVFKHDKRFIFEAGDSQALAELLLRYTKLGAEEYDRTIKELQAMFQKCRYKDNVEIWTKYICDILEKKEKTKYMV